MYFLETIGEMLESAWVPESAILPFKGGHEFKDLPVLRRRGKQKEKDYKYTVGNLNDLVGDTWIGGGKLFTCHFCPQIPKSLLTAWKVSVAEAEYLLPGGQRRTEGVPVTPVNGEERVPSPLPLEQAPERPPPTTDSHASHNGYQFRKSPAALDSHRNQPCKRKKKCLSDIFGHMVGGSKETAAVAKVADPFQTTTCALEGASKASPYADLESVPVLHRPRRAAVSPARAAARPLRRDDGSPGGKTESAENPTSSPSGGRTRSPPALDPERSLSGSEETASRSSQKHLATFPASSGLMTRALKAEEDTDLKDAQARRRICQLSSGAPVDASAQRDAFLSRPPAGAASSSSSFATHSSPKRRARKPDKKHIRNGSLAAPEPSGSSVLPPRRPVEVKAESVPQAVSAAPPPPSSPLQDVQELMFKSLVKEEGSSSGLTGFRPDANYKFSTFLMLLKDMHDTREKEGKPLALPPSPVLIKEEPLLVPGAAGDLGSCSRLTQGMKVETGQAERAVKPKKRTKPIMSSESYHFQDFPTNSQTEKGDKRHKEWRLPARIRPVIPGLSSDLANLAYGREYVTGHADLAGPASFPLLSSNPSANYLDKICGASTVAPKKRWQMVEEDGSKDGAERGASLETNGSFPTASPHLHPEEEKQGNSDSIFSEATFSAAGKKIKGISLSVEGYICRFGCTRPSFSLLMMKRLLCGVVGA